MNTTEEDLTEFLKYIMDVHTNQYGVLEICERGDNLDQQLIGLLKS